MCCCADCPISGACLFEVGQGCFTATLVATLAQSDWMEVLAGKCERGRTPCTCWAEVRLVGWLGERVRVSRQNPMNREEGALARVPQWLEIAPAGSNSGWRAQRTREPHVRLRCTCRRSWLRAKPRHNRMQREDRGRRRWVFRLPAVSCGQLTRPPLTGTDQRRKGPHAPVGIVQAAGYGGRISGGSEVSVSHRMRPHVPVSMARFARSPAKTP